jgi:hypothetical protein
MISRVHASESKFFFIFLSQAILLYKGSVSESFGVYLYLFIPYNNYIKYGKYFDLQYKVQ